MAHCLASQSHDLSDSDDDVVEVASGGEPEIAGHDGQTTTQEVIIDDHDEPPDSVTLQKKG